MQVASTHRASKQLQQLMQAAQLNPHGLLGMKGQLGVGVGATAYSSLEEGGMHHFFTLATPSCLSFFFMFCLNAVYARFAWLHSLCCSPVCSSMNALQAGVVVRAHVCMPGVVRCEVLPAVSANCCRRLDWALTIFVSTVALRQGHSRRVLRCTCCMRPTPVAGTTCAVVTLCQGRLTMAASWAAP